MQLNSFWKVKDDLTVNNTINLISESSYPIHSRKKAMGYVSCSQRPSRNRKNEKATTRESVVFWNWQESLTDDWWFDDCVACQTNGSENRPQPLQMSPLPPAPWHVVQWSIPDWSLVVIDAYSLFLAVSPSCALYCSKAREQLLFEHFLSEEWKVLRHALLLFRRTIKTKLPHLESEDVTEVDLDLKKKDRLAKEKMKLYADKKSRAQPSEMQTVLFRQTNSDPSPFQVVRVNGTMVTAVRNEKHTSPGVFLRFSLQLV